MRAALAIIVLVALAATANTGANVPQRHTSIQNITHAKELQQVQNICDAAHKEANGASEKACGDAQDRTNSEYICANASADSACWVEAK